MDVGGISVENIELTRDQKFSFDALSASWVYQYPGEADKMYDQVMLIVQGQCQEAYDESFKESGNFGPDMLKLVRKKIKERYAAVQDFFDCRYEHVMGMVGVLTEDCKVWWSKRFKI